MLSKHKLLLRVEFISFEAAGFFDCALDSGGLAQVCWRAERFLLHISTVVTAAEIVKIGGMLQRLISFFDT